jgi:hypothetical protein
MTTPSNLSDILPDIDSFSPWLLWTDEQLQTAIDEEYKQLQTLYANEERQYKIDLSIALYNLINNRNMSLWSKQVDNAVYKPRDVTITFNESQNFFNITANDGDPVLKGYPAEIIKNKGWFAASDGHEGVHAIVTAPKEAQEDLEAIFRNPREYLKAQQDHTT